MNKEAWPTKNYKTTFVIIDCEVDSFGKQLPNQCLRRSAKLTPSLQFHKDCWYIIWRYCHFLLDVQFYKVDNGVVNF